MKLEIRIIDDNEQVVAEYKGDPCQPGQWRAATGKAIKGNMPKQSDSGNTGTYDLAGFTYQPHVRVERPNGYVAPIPGSNNGQNSLFGPPQLLSKPSYSWPSIKPLSAALQGNSSGK